VLAIVTACVLAGTSLAPAGAFAADLKWRGMADLVAAEASDAFQYNVLTRMDGPFDPFRLRVFAESRIDDRLQVFSQLVFDDASNTYVDGAYVMYTPEPGRDLHVIAGKLPWAIGTFGPRTYSNKNPLIGTPLMYQYHSSLVWYDLPPDRDRLLSAAGTGQSGVNYNGYAMGVGMPIVDDSYWDVGVTLLGTLQRFEYSLGVTSGTPSWASTSKDDNSGKTVLGRIGFAPIPAVRVGVSGAYGPYLHDDLNAVMPAGRDVNDYHQELAMADLEVLLGRLELRAEGVHNVWQTPTVGDLHVTSGYGEAKLSFGSGLFLAGRWDAERFGDVSDSLGVKHPWDLDVTRIESGIGYRVTRETTVKLIYQRTVLDAGQPDARNRTLGIFGAQLSVGF
jgi:hypothetical protein